MSIRKLHEAADEARLRPRPSKRAVVKAEQAVHAASYKLKLAALFYLHSQTLKHYDELIASALACHATDTEATNATP